ncbi:hypothetical protein [Micromonospora humi]|uniref:Uncharacterized protein n=1 Tax=Micromonospora humi TaxID=745366 RepID=A0A1C5J2G9_9ACTN|nr:hypothetical protein [Micromonospora humi]SCG64808.1 hypothetical protein GA0070213_108146 [Micromonospora humi]
MVEQRGKSIGSYLLRVVGVVAVLCGLLMAAGSLINPNVVGVVLAFLLIGGGVFALKRSGGPRSRPVSGLAS